MVPLVMLTHMHLCSASSPGQPTLDFPLVPSMTIFVGPNNSGKSMVLREVSYACTEGHRAPQTQILNKLDFVGVDRATAEADFKQMKRSPNPGENATEGYSFVRYGGGDYQV